MRSVEEKIDIPEGRKDDFRREIMNYIGALAIDGKRSFELQDQRACLKKLSNSSCSKTKRTQSSSVRWFPMSWIRQRKKKIDVVKSRPDPQLRIQ